VGRTGQKQHAYGHTKLGGGIKIKKEKSSTMHYKNQTPQYLSRQNNGMYNMSRLSIINSMKQAATLTF